MLMHFLRLIKVLVALLLVCESGIVFSCAERHEWKDFSTISLTTESVRMLTMKRFTDGIYARIEGVKEVKEMYQLNGGIFLHRGLTASEQTGPSPFFMLDMPIGIVLGFLAQQFKQPCSIGSAPTPFAYTQPSGNSAIKVNGRAHRVNESEIIFDLIAVEQQERGATIKASGRVGFWGITPVPLDTIISGWDITRGSGVGTLATEVMTSQKISTIKDLKSLALEERKQ